MLAVNRVIPQSLQLQLELVPGFLFQSLMISIQQFNKFRDSQNSHFLLVLMNFFALLWQVSLTNEFWNYTILSS